MEGKKKLDVIVQHYISQALLKLFSTNEKFVYEFNLNNKKIYPEGISTTMSSKYTYEHPFLEGNTLERAFKKIEDEYSPLVRDIAVALDKDDVPMAKALIESAMPLVMLFYYRSGASLYEFSDNNDFGKESVLNRMLSRITDRRHLDKLAATIINDYSFCVLKSSEGKLALSDQYISTASLNCKGKIANFSNRTIGFSNCLIMIPISAKYYIVYFHGDLSLSRPVIANAIYELTPADTLSINKVIVRNSYNKCIAMHKEELEEVQHFRSTTCGTTGTIMKYDDGSYKSYTLKKEVFFYDDDADLFENYVPYCSQLIDFQKLHGKEIGRNDKCLCGSGKKLKKCCLKKYQQAKFIYDMIRYNQTDWMHTKSNYVEMPINEFWGFMPDLPETPRRIINDLEEAMSREKSIL